MPSDPPHILRLYDDADCDAWHPSGGDQPWRGDYDRLAAWARRLPSDCAGEEAADGVRQDIDGRVVPTLPWVVVGTVPGAMVWDLRTQVPDCAGP